MVDDDKLDLALTMSLMLSYLQFASDKETDPNRSKAKFDEAVVMFKRTLDGLGYAVVKKDN